MHLLRGHKVDCGPFSTETASSTDPMYVLLLVSRQLKVYDESDLLHIDAPSKQVCCDEYASWTAPELPHHDIPGSLVQLSMHHRYHKISRCHLLCQFLSAPLTIAVDQGLWDVEVLVEAYQYIKFPFILLTSYIVLVDTLKGQLLFLDQYSGRISHESVGYSDAVIWHSCGKKSDLNICGQKLKDLLDLVGESGWEHLVSFIKH